MRPKVLILGAGFAGLNVARRLAKTAVDITLIDKNNYHLFQPLLYQVAAAYLDPGQIAKPIRGIFQKQANLTVKMTEVTDIRFENRMVITKDREFKYDYLIIAVGGKTNYFEMKGVREKGFSLKTLGDAVEIRNHILSSFEKAMLEEDPAKRLALMTVVIGGGGPAGVETAGALAELIHYVLVKDFREVVKESFRVILCEAGKRLLPEMPADLAGEAERILRKKGVEIRFDSPIEDFTGSEIFFTNGKTMDAKTLIWTAGINAVDLTGKLALELGKNNRIVTERTLQIPGHPEVYAVGDAACQELKPNESPLPMVAPAAVQMAETAALNLMRQLSGKSQLDFTYKNPGAMATIGKNAAVAQIGGMKFKGFTAWIVWLMVHLVRLVGFRNRLVVLINWAWDYFFFERASRLILQREISGDDCG